MPILPCCRRLHLPKLGYGRTARPELRLITCGGPFDKRTGSYPDNTVVFARLAGVGTA